VNRVAELTAPTAVGSGALLGVMGIGIMAASIMWVCLLAWAWKSPKRLKWVMLAALIYASVLSAVNVYLRCTRNSAASGYQPVSQQEQPTLLQPAPKTTSAAAPASAEPTRHTPTEERHDNSEQTHQ